MIIYKILIMLCIHNYKVCLIHHLNILMVLENNKLQIMKNMSWIYINQEHKYFQNFYYKMQKKIIIKMNIFINNLFNLKLFQKKILFFFVCY
jgi:hypothetical protein